MGMYTELIFGAELKADLPKNVIEALQFMTGQLTEKPKGFPFEERRLEHFFRWHGDFPRFMEPLFFRNDVGHSWTLSGRVSLKNYENEIEKFLEWVKPYILSGSGSRDMYAISIYEEDPEPKIYYLD